MAQERIDTQFLCVALLHMAATSVRSWIAQDPAGHELHPAAAQVVLLPGLPAVPMGEAVDHTVSQARFLLVLHAPAHMVPGGQVGLLGALQQHVLGCGRTQRHLYPPVSQCWLRACARAQISMVSWACHPHLHTPWASASSVSLGNRCVRGQWPRTSEVHFPMLGA